MIDSSSFFNQFTNPNGMDFANDILYMGMLGSPSLGEIDGTGNKDNKHGHHKEKNGEPKGLLEKYVGTFQQQQQQQQSARSSGFRFAPDLTNDQGSRLGTGMNMLDSDEDSPISAGAAGIGSNGAGGPGEMETNSGDSLHQTHRQFLQHLQSMTAQQFHQAAMGSVSSGSNTITQNGMMNNLGGNRSGSTGASWGGYQTSSARFDDEDLLALMTGGPNAHDQSPDEQNAGRAETVPSGEFRQMMSDMHQHHLNSDVADGTNKSFSVSQQNQPDRRGSYVPVGGAEYGGQLGAGLQQHHHHLQAGPLGGLPASAPAAFQDGFYGGLGATASMGYGGYSYQPQGPQGSSGMGTALRGLPVITPQSSQAVPHPIDSLSRRLTRGTPSLVDGSFSSVGDASLFSSIMGGKWGNNDPYRTSYQQDGNGQGGQTHDGKFSSSRGLSILAPRYLQQSLEPGISVMSQGDGSGASGRSPDSFMEDDRDGDVRMKDGADSKNPVGRGRTKSTSKMGGAQGERQTKPKPKLARRSSSIAAAASGGSAVRNEAALGPASGVGKAPRAPSKTRPGHKRTGSNASRAPNVSVPGPTSPSSSGLASGNGTVSPVTFDYALPSLDATFISPRPDSIRKRSDSAAMTVDRANIELPSLRGQTNDPAPGQHSAAQMMSMAHQRRTGMARTPTSATLSMFPPVQLEEGLWRRHSMNDAVRPDLMSFASTGISGDGMATVDEAVIEDGDAEDSPQMYGLLQYLASVAGTDKTVHSNSLSAEELAKARISRRRLSHNEVERKRRETINEKIQELETLLPPNVVAGAIAAREVESIKEEDEDQLDCKPTELINGKGKKIKPRNRKVIKKAQVPDKLCKGTVLCLTVDLVK